MGVILLEGLGGARNIPLTPPAADFQPGELYSHSVSVIAFSNGFDFPPENASNFQNVYPWERSGVVNGFFV